VSGWACRSQNVLFASIADKFVPKMLTRDWPSN